MFFRLPQYLIMGICYAPKLKRVGFLRNTEYFPYLCTQTHQHVMLMKKHLLIFLSVMMISLQASAQEPTALWGKAVQGTVGSNVTSQGADIQMAPDGGLYISGGAGTKTTDDVIRFGNDVIASPQTVYNASGNTGTQNLFISKIAADGTPVWTVYSKSADVQSGKARLCPVSDGLIAVVGLRHAAQYYDTDIVLVDAEGRQTNLNWTISEEKGRYYRVLVLKFNMQGALQWMRQIDAAHDLASTGVYPNAMTVDGDGNIYIGGNQRVELTLKNSAEADVKIAPRNVDGWDGDSQKSAGDLFVLKLDKDGYYVSHLQTSGKATALTIHNLSYSNGQLYLLAQVTGIAGEQVSLGDKSFVTENTNGGLLSASINKDMTVRWAQHYPSAKSGSAVNLSNIYVNDKHFWISYKSNMSLTTSAGKELTCQHTRDGVLLKVDASDGRLLDGYVNQVNQAGYFSVFESTDGDIYALGHTLLNSLYIHRFNVSDLNSPAATWNPVIANVSDAQGIAFTADGRLYVMTRSNNIANALMGSDTKVIQDIAAYCCNVTAFQLPVTPVVTGIRNIESDNHGSDAYYNLSGQRIEHPKKGIYIQNGKKIVLK